MSEPAAARWDPSLSEALWRPVPSSDPPDGDAVDRLADHVDALWGGPRPEPKLDRPVSLLEAVWGPEAAREAANADAGPAARGPVQLSLFDESDGDTAAPPRT